MIVRPAFAALVLGLTLWGGNAVAEQTEGKGYSAAGLYNLGNANARAGKPGLAVLNYERARLLAPNDPDIAANLRVVRDAARLPAESASGIERAALMMNPTIMAWTGVLGVLLVGASLVWGSLHRRHRRIRRMIIPLGMLLIGLTLCNAFVLWPIVHEGVVLTAATPVRVTPVPMGDPAFVLPEAETVRITAQHEEFVLIRTRTGKAGWVSRANLAAVVPRR